MAAPAGNKSFIPRLQRLYKPWTTGTSLFERYAVVVPGQALEVIVRFWSNLGHNPGFRSELETWMECNATAPHHQSHQRDSDRRPVSFQIFLTVST